MLIFKSRSRNRRMGNGSDGHSHEAQVGRRPVRRRLRGCLEEIQRHRRSQNTSGKLDRLHLEQKKCATLSTRSEVNPIKLTYFSVILQS